MNSEKLWNRRWRWNFKRDCFGCGLAMTMNPVIQDGGAKPE
ncbi:MAG: hypothetical protein ACYC3B_02200 [Sedimentisphaerales bacterium]